MKWDETRLSELGVVSTGSTPKTAQTSYYGGNIPFVTPSDLDGDVPILKAGRSLTSAGAAEARMLPEGAVMVCCIGTLGKIGIAGCPMATNQQINSVVFDGSLVWPKYGFHACRLLRHTMECMAPATTLPIINKSKFGELTIPLPPLAEQKRIAGILDAADALRAKRRAALAQLDSLTQSLFLDLFGDPVSNPMGWERKSLGEIINFVGGSQPPKTTFSYEPKPGTVRLVQIRDFKSDRYRTYIPEKLAKRRFNEDDVMIARYGPPVFQILKGLSGSYNVALMRAEPFGDIEKLFIFHLLSHSTINSAVVAQSERTAGQTGVNLQFLNNYPAYLPPLPLQRRYAASPLWWNPSSVKRPGTAPTSPSWTPSSPPSSIAPFAGNSEERGRFLSVFFTW